MIIKHLLSKSFSRRSNYPKLHLFYAVISNKLRTFVPVSISLIENYILLSKFSLYQYYPFL